MSLMRKVFLLVVCLFLFSNLSVVSAATKESFDKVKKRNITHLRTTLQSMESSLKATIQNSKMESRLNNLISQITKGTETLTIVSNETHNEKINVILKISPDANDISGQIGNHGARILIKKGTTAVVEVPIDRLEQMVADIDEIEFARLPQRLFSLGDVSEGVNLFGANILHNNDFKGGGIKVAVIDIGFKELTDAINNGDIPDSIITHDYTGNGLQTEYYHGTACAEIVHDMAPQAELHLLKVYDEIDIYNALDYCINNAIDIISLSLGTFGTGPGDGTGILDELFDQLREAGILVVAAAGNSGNTTEYGLTLGSHWEGIFDDSNGDDTHEFIAGDPDSTYNIIAALPIQDDDGNPETDEVTIIMRWNDWPDADIDYDIYLYDYNYETGEIGDLVDSSNALQTGLQPPLEGIFIDLPDNEDYVHWYALVVSKKQGEPSGTELELFLGPPSMFMPFEDHSSAIAVSSGSILEPADAESVLAVGAIDYQNWETGPQEDFSSQGPTNAWAGSSARIKPDICGPDGVTTYSYGNESFFGTSAATPHVAGAAALILSLNPDLSTDQLQSLIESNAIDMGDTGKDNIYGWGKIDLGFIMDDSWRLISLSKQPANTDIGAVLDSIIDKVISVWAYSEGSWKVYDPENPGFSDLTTMEAGSGYWLHLSVLASLTVSGSAPSNSIELTSGWNLVGYNSDTSQSVSDALASIEGKYISVWAYINGFWQVYDPNNPGFSDLTTMEPGYGYWINMNEACTWILP